MNNDFQLILRKWENGGKKVLTNGTELLCHVPHVAPQAWFHIMYTALSSQEIKDFEELSPIPFPIEYKEFLSKANGINIFSDSLSIWGLRHSYQRTGEEALQPYDLLSLNSERPKGCSDTWLFFGSYSWDGTRVMFDMAEGTFNNKVYRCPRRSTQIIQEWPSFWVWLDSEINRLAHLYDAKGVKYNKQASTAPAL